MASKKKEYESGSRAVFLLLGVLLLAAGALAHTADSPRKQRERLPRRSDPPPLPRSVCRFPACSAALRP